jgi:beta-phosphoglucomutase-like phosphatase (HAD superfamily)
VLRAVIFDIDDTIVDSVDLHAKAWQVAFAEFGKEVSVAAIRKEIGKGADQLLPVFFSKDELDRFGEKLDKYRGELFKREYLPRVKSFQRSAIYSGASTGRNADCSGIVRKKR